MPLDQRVPGKGSGRSITGIFLAVIAAGLLAAAGSACAEDAGASAPAGNLADLELAELMQLKVETVTVASKYAQKVTDAPASISVVTAEEIRLYGYRTLADILRSVPGFYVGYDRNYSYVGVRGIAPPGDYNTRLLVMINGQRINDSVYSQGSSGTEMPLDVDLIERVEVIRGPGSSIYGTDALLGVINLITRSGRELNGVEVAGAYGSFESAKARLAIGREFDSKGRFLLAGTWEESDGDDHLSYRAQADPETTWVAEDLDGDRARRLFALGTWGDLTAQGIYSRRQKDVPTAIYEMRFNDPRAETVDEYQFFDVKYERTFADDLRLLARGNFSRYTYDADYPYEAEDDSGPYSYVNRDEVDARRWGGEVQLVKPLFARHLLTAGGEVLYNDRQTQKNYDGGPNPYSYLDDTRDSTVWALFLQDEIRLLDNLFLSAGLRYDHYDSFGATTNPRLAVVYSPTEDITVKLLYGEAFRAPNAYELYYSDKLYTSANPDLDPETLESWELAVEHTLGKHLRYSLAAFYLNVDDLILQGADPDNPDLNRFDNSGGFTSKGFECVLDAKWPSGVLTQGSYTFAQVEDDHTGKRPPNSPKHLAKFNLRVPLLDERLQAGLELLYTGSRKTVYATETDDYLVANLTLFSHGLCAGLDLSASVYNLFDTSYSDPGSRDHLQDSIEQDGRTFRITASYRY